MSESTLEAALAYKEHLPVRLIPVPAGVKRATMPGWQREATREKTTLEAWYQHNTTLNVGAVLDPGWFVLDLDCKRHKDGLARIAELEAELGKLPATLTAQTPSGGQHRYFYGGDAPFVSAADVAGYQGVDIRAGGTGYAMLPPSRTVEDASSGTSAGVYAWMNWPDLTQGPQIARAPRWLITLACGEDPRTTSTVPTQARNRETADVNPPDAEQLEDLRAALEFINANDYDIWIDVGHALKTGGDRCRDLWLNWSRTSESWKDEDAKRWDGFHAKRTAWKRVFSIAQGAGWENPGQRTKSVGFSFVSVGDLLVKPEPVKWLIRDMIEEGTLAQLFGASKAGKSFVALDWAACIAKGTPWHKKTVEQGQVFYVAGEGHAGIKRRLRAWELHNGIPLQGAPLHISTCPAALVDPESASAVADSIEGMASTHGMPKLIVVDTLARNLGNGDESSNADMSRFINNVDVHLRTRFGCGVLIVHHTGWSQTERSRGASGLPAAVDHEFRLTHRDDDLRELTATKMKESELPPSITFRLKQVCLDGWFDADGEVMASAVLVPSESGTMNSRALKLTDREKSALADLEQAIKTVAAEQIAQAWGMPSTSLEAWRAVFYGSTMAGETQDASRKAFKRAQDSLRAKGVIDLQGGFVWITKVRFFKQWP